MVDHSMAVQHWDVSPECPDSMEYSMLVMECSPELALDAVAAGSLPACDLCGVMQLHAIV